MFKFPVTVNSIKQLEEVAQSMEAVEEYEIETGSQVINEETSTPKLQVKIPIQPVKRSNRNSEDGMLMQEKAEQVKAKLNKLIAPLFVLQI